MSDSYKVKYQQLKEDHPRAFSPKVLLPTRFFLISVIVIFTKISESTQPVIPQKECIIDYIHKIMLPLNSSLRNHPFWINIFNCLYSLLVDLSFLSFQFYWIYKGNSMRLVISIIIFYFLKIVLDSVMQETIPANMIFQDLPILSLLIKSGVDYNFPCPIVPGIYTILFIECQVEIPKLKKTACVLQFFNILSIIYMIIIQRNYTSDIISSVISSITASLLSYYQCQNFIDKMFKKWFDLNSQVSSYDNEILTQKQLIPNNDSKSDHRQVINKNN